MNTKAPPSRLVSPVTDNLLMTTDPVPLGVIGMFPLLFFPDDHHHDCNGNGGNNNTSASIHDVQSENERLKAEVALLRGKFQALAKEKQDAMWNKGY